MRILYLYIESFRCFRPEHPIELNFTNDYRFKLEKSSYGCQLGCVEAESKLHSNFFSMSNEKSVVMEISAIVGENGSGKTTLASFFQRFRMSNAGDNKFIIVYEQTLNKSWSCISSLKDIVMPTNGSATLKAGFVWKQDQEVALEIEDALRCSFDYVYYSPHYTTQQAFSLHDDPSCVNLSTAALLGRRPEYFFNKDISRRDNISFVERGYVTEQNLWILDFVAEYKKWEGETKGIIDIPVPRIVFLSPDEDMEDVSMAVLVQLAQGSRLPLSGDADYVIYMSQKVIKVVEWLKSISSDFFFRALRIFLLNYFRNVSMENKRAHQDTDTYGIQLLEWLSSLVSKDGWVKADIAKTIVKQMEDLRWCKSALMEQKGICAAVRFFAKSYEYCLPFWRSNVQVQNIPFEQESAFGISEDLMQMIVDHGLCAPINTFVNVKFDPPLASGEMTFLSMFGRLYWYFKNRRDGNKEVLLFLDEAETTLHPEWQQKLVSSIISFLNHVAKGSSIHVIFATHSPILLSDIPIRNAIFLKRKFDDEQLRRGSHTEQVCTENARLGYANTFAANIIDLMGLSFFMKEGTIGFFARKKIQDVLKREIREEDADSILDLIGDPFIFKIVKDSLES